MDIEFVRSRFIKHFDGTTGSVYASPGRINLIGEHTDYNGGFVFPGAVDKGMIIEIKPNGTDIVKAYSIDLKDYVEFGLNEEDAPRASWARYIFGVCREMIKRGVEVKGFNTAFAGDVPLGAGMSSSAALESATAASSVTLGVLMADRTPAMINYSLGQDVALDSCSRAGIKTILTSRLFLEKIKWEQTPEMICLEDVAPTITKGAKRKAIFSAIFSTWKSLARKISPLSCFNLNHQAVLLFSSGSTGKPKAVMLTHRNLNCDIYAFIRVIAWTPQDRIAGNLPLFHAYGFMIGVAFPSVGNTLVAYVLNPLDSAGVVRMVAKNKITILTATPTFLQSYMRKAEPKDFATLRLMITGAEKLRKSVQLLAHY